VGHKHEVEITKWKVLLVENLIKVVMYDQMFQNQGEELFVVLNESQILMVQLYYQKECGMVIKFNVAMCTFEGKKNMRKHRWKKRRKIRMTCKKSLIHTLQNNLEGRNK
jgi:hypothetical protein